MASLWHFILCCLIFWSNATALLDGINDDIHTVCNSLKKDENSCILLLSETATRLFTKKDEKPIDYELIFNNSNEIEVLQYHIADLITSCNNNRQCIKSLKETVTSTKLKLFYELIYGQYLANLNILHQEFYNKDLPEIDYTLLSLEKAIILHDIIDNPKVEVICEIGLTTGVISSFSLVTNPLAKLVSFDFLLNNITAIASNALLQLFENRVINIVAGPSAYTIPHFSSLMVTSKCNVIYVNGASYTPEELMRDLQSLPSLVNESHNQIVIDNNPISSINIFNDKLHRVNRVNYPYFTNLKWDPHNSTKGYIFDTGTADYSQIAAQGSMDICTYVL